MAGPIVTDKSELGALGVRIVDAIVHDDLKYLFREKARRDLGIDGEIELVNELEGRRRGSGRLLALQIKCGESYFREQKADAIIYRGDPKHLDYWTDLSIPVLIILCHPESREAYWAEFIPSAVKVLKSGWKMRIPLANKLDKAGYEIRRIAERNHLLEVMDFAIQSWMHSAHEERVEFCGVFQMPRDYHWYRHLVRVGEETVMLHGLYARYGRFDLCEIDDVLEYLPRNLEYAPKLVLCFVAETFEPLELNDDIMKRVSRHPEIEIRRLLFKRGEALVGEVRENGYVDMEYHCGRPIYSENAEGHWVA